MAAVDGTEEQEDVAEINVVQAGGQCHSQRGGQLGGRGGIQRGGQRGSQRGGQRGGQGVGQSGCQLLFCKGEYPLHAAVMAAGICWAHWRFGEQAFACKGTTKRPCNWQRN